VVCLILDSPASSTQASNFGFQSEHCHIYLLATGNFLTKISEATPQDVDTAVKAAQDAFATTWGLNAPGAKRGELLYKLGTLMDAARDELSALEALDNGKKISTRVSCPKRRVFF
jgi:acyl-CoA reductase-like NAD-dependent aldehyde dehydrogenase